jgi:O-antigen ligase
MIFNDLRGLGLVGAASSLLVNSPSLKLFLGNTPFVNLVATTGLGSVVLLYAVLYKKFEVNYSGVYITIALGVIFLLCILPVFFDFYVHSGFVTQAFRYLYNLALFVLISFNAKISDIKVFVKLQVVWGATVAIAFLIGWIQYESGQHYNTVSLPIGLSSVIVILYGIDGKSRSISKRVSLFTIFIINFVGLVNLYGRSPFIFVVLIILLISILRRRTVTKRIMEVVRGTVILGGLVGIGIFIIEYLNITYSKLLIDRLFRLIEDPSSESRINWYLEALKMIGENPLGSGFDAYSHVTGHIYPHNLILEVAVSGGILAGILMLFVFTYTGYKYFYLYHNSNIRCILHMSGCFLYLLLTFMVSYSISGAYMLFSAIALGFAEENNL